MNHQLTWYSVTAERSFLRALGGGCRAPIAALGSVEGDILRLDGMVANVHTREILRAAETGSALNAEEVGVKLANRLLSMGASDFITEARA